jgi:hypothetical protein
MVNKTVLRFALSLLFAAVPAAGTVLYDFSSFDFNNRAYEFSFTEPDLLSSTTTISTPDLHIITQATTCTITTATFANPLSANPEESDCTGRGNLVGPFDHLGTYSNGAQEPSILTISSVATAAPEPASVFLLLPLAPAVLLVRKRTASEYLSRVPGLRYGFAGACNGLRRSTAQPDSANSRWQG